MFSVNFYSWCSFFLKVRHVIVTRAAAKDNGETKYLAKKGRAAMRLDQLNKEADALTADGQWE